MNWSYKYGGSIPMGENCTEAIRIVVNCHDHIFWSLVKVQKPAEKAFTKSEMYCILICIPYGISEKVLVWNCLLICLDDEASSIPKCVHLFH